MGKLKVDMTSMAGRIRVSSYAMCEAPECMRYTNKTTLAVAHDQWLSMNDEEKAGVIERHFRLGNFGCIEKLLTFSPRTELTKLISMIPHEVQMMYVNYINTCCSGDKHIVTNEETRQTLEACCNVALVFIINSVQINICMERMVQAWGKSGIVNKRVLGAIQTMRRIWAKADDIACTLMQSSVMPIIWEKMNALRNEYKGSSSMVDYLQGMVEDDSLKGVDVYHLMCEDIKSDNDNDSYNYEVVRYAFILHSIMSSSCDEIQRRYDHRGEFGEKTMKAIGIKKVDLSSLKKFIDNAKLVASVASGYSITQDMWMKTHKAVTDHLAKVYYDMSDKVTDAFRQQEKMYIAYYFAVLVCMKREGTKIPDAMKTNCISAMQNKMGYQLVMKDVKKLDINTRGDDNPYSIMESMLKMIERGERFPAFTKIIGITDKEHTSNNEN